MRSAFRFIKEEIDRSIKEKVERLNILSYDQYNNALKKNYDSILNLKREENIGYYLKERLYLTLCKQKFEAYIDHDSLAYINVFNEELRGMEVGEAPNLRLSLYIPKKKTYSQIAESLY